MTNRTLMLCIKHLLGIGNALAAVHSVANGIYSMAAVNTVAMLYISTMWIPPKESK